MPDFRDAVEQGCDKFTPIREYEAPSDHSGTTFTSFCDIDGSKVRVRLSSAAMRECARVSIDLADWQIELVRAGSRTSVGLHLCRCMAAELVDALSRAFEGTLQERPACAERRIVR